MFRWTRIATSVAVIMFSVPATSAENIETVISDCSSTVTSGGAAQTLVSANAARNGIIVQNISSGDLWINPLGTASAGRPSLKIPPGSYYESPFRSPIVTGTGPTSQVTWSIYGATTSQEYTCWGYR